MNDDVKEVGNIDEEPESDSSPEPGQTLAGISRIYRACALVVFNLLILLAVINLALYGLFKIKDAAEDDRAERHASHVKRVAEVLDETRVDGSPKLTSAQIEDVIEETVSRPFAYEAFTQFKERRYEGDFVNVEEAGYRITKNQGPWPPDPDKFNVFCFGGSTTFGYGVPDDQTIPSYLQPMLADQLGRDVRVYNFGRGYYYSTQERILFEHLLISGYVPDLAIFLDGINDYHNIGGRPVFTARLRQYLDHGRMERLADWLRETEIPIVRAINSVVLRVRGDADNQDSQGDDAHEMEESMFANVATRYYENKKLIEASAAVHGVKPVFIWQPAPTFKYDLKHHAFAKAGFGTHARSGPGYEYMETFVKERPMGQNFLWLGDMQKDLQEPLYIDTVHYTPAMSMRIAQSMADFLVQGGFLKTES